MPASAPRVHGHTGHQEWSSPNPGANGWTGACVKQQLHIRGQQLRHHHWTQHEWQVHLPQTGGTVSDHGSDRSKTEHFNLTLHSAMCDFPFCSKAFALVFQALMYLLTMPRFVLPIRFSPGSVWTMISKQILPPLCWK